MSALPPDLQSLPEDPNKKNAPPSCPRLINKGKATERVCGKPAKHNSNYCSSCSRSADAKTPPSTPRLNLNVIPKEEPKKEEPKKEELPPPIIQNEVITMTVKEGYIPPKEEESHATEPVVPPPPPTVTANINQENLNIPPPQEPKKVDDKADVSLYKLPLKEPEPQPLSPMEDAHYIGKLNELYQRFSFLNLYGRYPPESLGKNSKDQYAALILKTKIEGNQTIFKVAAINTLSLVEVVSTHFAGINIKGYTNNVMGNTGFLTCMEMCSIQYEPYLAKIPYPVQMCGLLSQIAINTYAQNLVVTPPPPSLLPPSPQGAAVNTVRRGPSFTE